MNNNLPLDKQTPPKLYIITSEQQLPNESPVYLLIDGALFKALSLAYSQGGAPSEIEVLYHDTPLADQLDISPIVIPYEAHKLSKSYARWQPYTVAFTTKADLKTTANHLRSLLLCKMPNTQPAFFRYYAHTWLEAIITGQEEDSLYEFTGPINQWFIPQEDTTWRAITIAKQTTAKAASQQAWFNLSQPIIDQLSNYTYQCFIDERTQRYTEPNMSEQATKNLRDTVNNHAQFAQYYGISQRDHITRYTDLAFQYPTLIKSDGAINLLEDGDDVISIKLKQLKRYLETTAASLNQQTTAQATDTTFSQIKEGPLS